MNLGGGGIFASTMNGNGVGTPGGLVMNGTGTLLVDGPSNTYTGGTTINSGRLIALTNLPAGAVALNGGTLAGISSIGNLTMQGGTEVVPGSTTVDGSIGTLTMNSLTVNGGDFRLDISANAGGSDLIAVTGGATFSARIDHPRFLRHARTGKLHAAHIRLAEHQHSPDHQRAEFTDAPGFYAALWRRNFGRKQHLALDRRRRGEPHLDRHSRRRHDLGHRRAG